MQRRQLLSLAAAGLAALALPALAQQERRVRRIGYFSGGSLQGGQATYLPAPDERQAGF